MREAIRVTFVVAVATPASAADPYRPGAWLYNTGNYNYGNGYVHHTQYAYGAGGRAYARAYATVDWNVVVDARFVLLGSYHVVNGVVGLNRSRVTVDYPISSHMWNRP